MVRYQRGGRCPIPRTIPGEVVWGSEQPVIAKDVPAQCKGFGLDGLLRSFQSKPFFHSMNTGEDTAYTKPYIQPNLHSSFSISDLYKASWNTARQERLFQHPTTDAAEVRTFYLSISRRKCGLDMQRSYKSLTFSCIPNAFRMTLSSKTRARLEEACCKEHGYTSHINRDCQEVEVFLNPLVPVS